MFQEDSWQQLSSLEEYQQFQGIQTLQNPCSSKVGRFLETSQGESRMEGVEG